MEFVMVWLAISMACAIVAGNKGRSSAGWFVLGLLFSILALLIVVVLPSLKPADAKPTPDTHIKCPDCREFVLRDARVCKHCGCKLIPQ